MKYAVIFQGKVVNTIIASPEFLASVALDADAIICIDDLPVGVGWLYDGEKFINPYTEVEDAKPL